MSIKEWVEQEKPWEKKTWEDFIEQDLVPFYEVAYQIYAILKKFEEFKESPSISDIPKEFRDRVKTAVYGGVKNGREIEEGKSFARFIYDKFGVAIEGSESFEDSIKKYAQEGEYLPIKMHEKSYIKKVELKNVVSTVSKLIKTFYKSFYNKDLNEVFAEKNLNLRDSSPLLYVPDREQTYDAEKLYNIYFKILPDPENNNSPEEIVRLFSEFEERAAKISVGVNPHMTFAFYIRCIPLEILCQLLGDTDKKMEKAKSLFKVLGPHPYDAYTITTLKKTTMPENRNPNIFLQYSYSNSSGSAIGYLINLSEYLLNTETSSENFESFVRKSMNTLLPQTKNLYEPWDCFLPLFKKAIECSSSGCYYYASIENDKMENCGIPLKDFIIKLFPLMASGVIARITVYSNRMELYFSKPAKEFAEQVIEMHGGD